MQYRDRKRDIVITCPHCGREYLPAEIYIPTAFFGHPEDIDRFENGEIEVYDGAPMNLVEEYNCDYCGEDFIVTADVRFKTVRKNEPKFNQVYVSKLTPSKVSLFEDLDNTEA